MKQQTTSAPTHDQQWQQLQADYWRTYKDEYPALVCEFDAAYTNGFLNESIEDYQRRYQWAGGLLKRLADIPLESLAPDNRISYQVLERELQLVCQNYELDVHLRPVLSPFGPARIINYYGISRMTVLSITDAKDYLARMRCFVTYIQDTQQRLQKGLEKGYRLPKALLEPTITSTLAFTEPSIEDSAWYQPFTSLHIAGHAEIATLQASAKQCIKDDIIPAYHRFADYLREEYAPHCTSSPACSDQPNGKAYYQLLIQYNTSLDISPDEIHQTGLEEVARIQQEIDAVAEQAGYTNNRDGFLDFIANDSQFFLPNKKALRERAEMLSKQIDRLIPEYFGRIPRMTYGVKSIPESSASLAFAQANPADGRSSGIYWLTSLPERCPTYAHIPLALHEAWPGHLMHFALMQEIDSLPQFRRINFFNYNAYIEGWALYCERLGLDMGLYQTPYDHFGRLKAELKRAVRLVVDTGVHSKGWSRQQAIDYMQAQLKSSPSLLEAEVDRYIGDPAQALSYKLGELKIQALRQRAETALGDQFSLRDFHDCVLATGPVTLGILEAQVQCWIDSKQQRQYP